MTSIIIHSPITFAHFTEPSAMLFSETRHNLKPGASPHRGRGRGRRGGGEGEEGVGGVEWRERKGRARGRSRREGEVVREESAPILSRHDLAAPTPHPPFSSLSFPLPPPPLTHPLPFYFLARLYPPSATQGLSPGTHDPSPAPSASRTGRSRPESPCERP